MKWVTVELGECVTELRGGASIKGEEFTDAGFPVLHKGTIRAGGYLVFERDGKSHVPVQYADAKANSVVDSGFVVSTFRNLVRTGETLGFTAPVPEGREFLLAQGAYGLKLDESRLDKRYLSHLSNAWIFHKEVLKRMVGTTQVHIRNSEFLKIPIPLPLLAEQKRIAKMLDAADALRAKRRESIEQLDTMVQSAFLKMFGDPVTNPKGWEVKELADACQKITDGTHHPPPTLEGGIPYITAKHLKKDGLKFSDDPWYVSPEHHSEIFARCNPERGDVLYIKDGVTTGIAAINRYDFEFSMLSSLALLKPNKKVIGSEYLCGYLNNERNRSVLTGRMGGAAIKRLTLAKIKKFLVPIPPTDLQDSFANILDSIEQQRTYMHAHLGELDTLFASLQSRAFKGEL